MFGPGLGRSYAKDIYLPAVSGTCVEALERGVPPVDVWHSLVEEMGAGDAAKWIHRLDENARRAFLSYSP